MNDSAQTHDSLETQVLFMWAKVSDTKHNFPHLLPAWQGSLCHQRPVVRCINAASSYAGLWGMEVWLEPGNRGQISSMLVYL